MNMMCRPKWPFFHMYGSHYMRHVDFRGLTGSQRTPRVLGRHRISTKENKKSPGGGTITWVTSPIRIKETMQCYGNVCKKPNTKGSCAIKITKQTFDPSPMVLGWRVHKLREFIHDKGNIWVSHPEMLEATNHLTVHGGIYRRIIYSS